MPIPEEIEEVRRIVDSEPTDVIEALQQLTAIKEGMGYWSDRLQATVAYLRDQDVTWAEIGDYLGVTASAVHQRFNRGLRVGLS